MIIIGWRNFLGFLKLINIFVLLIKIIIINIDIFIVILK